MLCFWHSRQVRSKRVYGGINSQLEAFIRTTTARQASGAICELLAANKLRWYHEIGSSLYWRHESILDKVNGVARGMLLKMRQREGRATSFLSGPMAERLTTIAVCSGFCITASGFMGRVPLAAQKGDIIAVLAGGKVPFVLREAGRRGLYSVVGDCCKSAYGPCTADDSVEHKCGGGTLLTHNTSPRCRRNNGWRGVPTSAKRREGIGNIFTCLTTSLPAMPTA